MPVSMPIEQIKKRDGRIVPFDRTKILRAIKKAAQTVHGSDGALAETLTDSVVAAIEELADGALPTVELIQDAIEKALLEGGHGRIAKAFILYRARRSRIREAKTELMDAVEEILAEVDRDELALPCSPSEKMLRIGATASKEFYLKRMLPEEIADAHLRGDLYLQDLEHYAKAPNSFVIPLERLLRDGYRSEHGAVRPPKRAHTAASVAAIALQAAQNDCFGGQAFSRFDGAMAAVLPAETSPGEIDQAMEGLVYNLNMLHSRTGGQVPYSTLSIGLDSSPMARQVAFSVLDAFERGLGRGEPAIYPNLVFLCQEGVNLRPEDPNHDLYLRALEVASRRMQPTFAFLDAPFNLDRDLAYLSGCARLADDRFGVRECAGRGSLGTISLNLPRIALRAKRDRLDVFQLLERQVQLGLRALVHRFGVLGALKMSELPFLVGEQLYAGSSALRRQDEVAEALRHGQLGFGFVGLAEMLLILEGAHHGQSEVAQALGLRIVRLLRDAIDAASQANDLNMALYGQLADRSATRFPLLDRRDYGVVGGVTDKGYYTSAFSLPADFEIDASARIRLEAPYHAICNGGHLTAIEWEAPETDGTRLAALLASMREAGIGHGAVNFPLDHCSTCGHQGIIERDCPACQAPAATIRRIRRLAGYLAPLERFSPGKLEELKARHANP